MFREFPLRPAMNCIATCLLLTWQWQWRASGPNHFTLIPGFPPRSQNWWGDISVWRQTYTHTALCHVRPPTVFPLLNNTLTSFGGNLFPSTTFEFINQCIQVPEPYNVNQKSANFFLKGQIIYSLCFVGQEAKLRLWYRYLYMTWIMVKHQDAEKTSD